MATIAIVDNDDDSREVLQVLMETEGFSVQQFKSGKDFLSKFTPGLFIPFVSGMFPDQLGKSIRSDKGRITTE